MDTQVVGEVNQVTDQYGMAFRGKAGSYKFEAQPGGAVQVRFKRKFL